LSADRVLVGWIPTAEDLRLFEEARWYRIPLDVAITRPETWRPPAWVAAFESKRASGSEQRVARYAKVLAIQVKTREELLGAVAPGPKRDRKYYQLLLGAPRLLPSPLVPPRSRQRTTFIWTTLPKLLAADGFNDLFDESPPENDLWNRLKSEDIAAERQWPESANSLRYILDFAIFCRNRNIDVEMDGLQHHTVQVNSENDADRDRNLTSKGWAIHRIRASEYRQAPVRAVRQLCETIEEYGGVESSFARFVPTTTGVVKQLRLLEERAPYQPEGTQRG
jgi:very-short-patch-repair endonuclease